MSCRFHRQKKFAFLLIGGLAESSSNISMTFVASIPYSGLTIDDEKWSARLKAVGMAQGSFHIENVTSAKFRVFLAEHAINYLFAANVGANVLLTNNNIGCPNISLGPCICLH